MYLDVLFWESLIFILIDRDALLLVCRNECWLVVTDWRIVLVSGHNVMRRSVLQPQLYELHGMAPNVSSSTKHAAEAAATAAAAATKSFMPHRSELDSHWDWDPTSKLLFGSGGQKYSGTVGSELFNVATPPLLTGNPFMTDLASAAASAGAADSSLANLMKTSTVLQQCVSASKPLTTTTVTTSTGITTSVTGGGSMRTETVSNSFTDAHDKILKVSTALLRQQLLKEQQQKQAAALQKRSECAATTTTSTVSYPMSSSQTLPTPSSTAFTFTLPASPQKNKQPPLGLGAFGGASTSMSSFAAAASSLQSSLSSLAGGASSQSEFCFKHPFTSQTSAFSCPQMSSSNGGTATSSTPPAFSMTSSSSSTSFSAASSSPSSSSGSQHQVKLNPDFIRAAAALQKAISEQNQQQQQQQSQQQAAAGLGASTGFQAFQNLNLQNLSSTVQPPPMPNLNLLSCSHQLTHGTGQSASQSVSQLTLCFASSYILALLPGI